jgi:hypothetical protein
MVRRSGASAWSALALESWALGWEASTVIGLRMAKISRGDDSALGEASLMVSEKVSAAIELNAALLRRTTGMTPLAGTQHAVRLYRRKVRANRRRLGLPAWGRR